MTHPPDDDSWIQVLDADGRPRPGFEALAPTLDSLERTVPWGRRDDPWRFAFDFGPLQRDDLLEHAMAPLQPLGSVRAVCSLMPRDRVRVDAHGVHVAPQAVERFIDALRVLDRSCHGSPEARGIVVVAESAEGDLFHHPDRLDAIADHEELAWLDEDVAERVWHRATEGTLLEGTQPSDAHGLLDQLCGRRERIGGHEAVHSYWSLPPDEADRLEDDIARVAARLPDLVAEAEAEHDDDDDDLDEED